MAPPPRYEQPPPKNRKEEVDQRVKQLIAEVKFEVDRGNGGVFQRRREALKASMQPGGAEYERMRSIMSLRNMDKRDKAERKRIKKMIKEQKKKESGGSCTVM